MENYRYGCRLLHANTFEPDTAKPIKGYEIADNINFVWGAQFDTFVKEK